MPHITWSVLLINNDVLIVFFRIYKSIAQAREELCVGVRYTNETVYLGMEKIEAVPTGS
jgi:hypothetical protein